MKKRMEVEKALSWCFGQEMPKARRLVAGQDALSGSTMSTWAAVQRFALLGTLVDEFGLRQDSLPEPEPIHPDAFVIADAVAGIGSGVVTMPDGYDVLAGLDVVEDGKPAPLTQAEREDLTRRGFDIAWVKGDQLHVSIIRRSIIGNAPNWRDHGIVRRQYVRGPNGREAWFRMVPELVPTVDGGATEVMREVSGIHRRTKRRLDGAYRKPYFAPCPSLLAAERIDYQAWAGALDLIADSLANALSSIEVLPRLAPLWPWEGEEQRAGPRIIFANRTDNGAPRARQAA